MAAGLETYTIRIYLKKREKSTTRYSVYPDYLTKLLIGSIIRVNQAEAYTHTLLAAYIGDDNFNNIINMSVIGKF